MCHSLLLFSLITLPEMENSITGRVWFVTVRCLLFRLRSAGGFQDFFFSPSSPRFLSLSIFSLRDSVMVFARALQPCTPPLPPATAPLLLKTKGVFSSKEKKGEKSKPVGWGDDKSHALCYWNILSALGSLTFYYKR